MRHRLPPLLAAACALPACASKPAAVPPAAAASPAAAAPSGPAPTADDPAAVLPGVSLDGLSPEQQRVLAEFALSEYCYCGCPHTLSECLRVHKGCKHAPRMVALAARLIRAGARDREDLSRAMTAYYASFDKRVRLDVADFGPPLGDASAPVTLVEFSDFTCPYCQAVRPALERFVTENASRVKLFYKPFPIESHPGAFDMAEAGEWAREHGLFWPMHDALFTNPHETSTDALADHARELGGDPGDLRAAVESKRYEARIRASQAEGRAAGMRGTPTIFIDGRMLGLPDSSAETLEFTLEDEEEWQKHHGFERD